MNKKNVHPLYKSNTDFDIRNHVDRLEPAKDKGKYLCPICGDDNFSINQKSGAYKCFGNDCDTGEIAKALSPQGNGFQHRTKPKSYKERDKQAITDSIKIELKVDELFLEVMNGVHTPRQAMITMTTWAKEHGHDRFECKALLKEKLDQLKAASEPETPCKLLKNYAAIEKAVGKDLKLNELRNELEWQGEPLDPGRYQLFIARVANLEINENHAISILGDIGEKNSYHPVREWLISLYQKYGDSTSHLLDSPSNLLLKTTKPLYDSYLRRQLIAAVKRVFQPGCKDDYATILQGAQGVGKSTFWRVLAGDDWFDDTVGANLEDKDELAKLHQTWFEELGEFDRITSKKEAALVKSFVTRQSDRYRAPYDRVVKKHDRRFVLVGSVNPNEFLVDDTGNRRMLVIPVRDKIDIAQARRLRDQIWAAAYARYLKGEDNQLTPEEEEMVNLENRDWSQLDVWQEAVEEYLSHESCLIEKNGVYYAVPLKILEYLNIPAGQQRQEHKRRLQKVLVQAGWSPVKEKIRLPGFKTTLRAWFKPGSVPEANSGTSTGTSTGTCQSPDKSILSDSRPGCPGRNEGVEEFVEINQVDSDDSAKQEDLFSVSQTYRDTGTNPQSPHDSSISDRPGECPGTRPGNLPGHAVEILKPGDAVHYVGTDLRSLRVCGSLLLHVLDVDGEQGVARVRAENWSPQISKTYKFSELKKVQTQVGGAA